jgi:hypothetical protein
VNEPPKGYRDCGEQRQVEGGSVHACSPGSASREPDQLKRPALARVAATMDGDYDPEDWANLEWALGGPRPEGAEDDDLPRIRRPRRIESIEREGVPQIVCFDLTPTGAQQRPASAACDRLNAELQCAAERERAAKRATPQPTAQGASVVPFVRRIGARPRSHANGPRRRQRVNAEDAGDGPGDESPSHRTSLAAA